MGKNQLNHHQSAPPIDYDLLRSKQIHWFGVELTFDS